MKTLILIGGNSQRFKDAGYTTPKCLLPLFNHFTILDAIFSTIEATGDEVYLMGREEMRGEWEWPKLHRRSPLNYVWSSSEQTGPLGGILDASAQGILDDTRPVLISYCDVWFPIGINSIVRRWKGCHSGGVLFKSDDNRYGYWKNDRVYEKQVVSEWAVSGLFYWRESKSLRDSASKVFAEDRHSGLPHVLDWRSKMVKVGAGYVVDLGTPQQYEAWAKKKVEVAPS